MQRVVCWFSCGAASAVATKLALAKYRSKAETIVAYCDTGSEHPDNERFMRECVDWFKHDVTILKNPKYEDIWDVYKKENYLIGHIGARCSLEMKKRVREKFERPDDIQVFGYTSSEDRRAKQFKKNNPQVNLEVPLIANAIHKRDCKAILKEAGIAIPAMYKLGYKNNNCIGCVKGGKGYWNKIRKDFPETFDRMAKEERRLGITINTISKGKKVSRIYLDELPPDVGNYKEEPDIVCGFVCQEVLSDMWDDCEL